MFQEIVTRLVDSLITRAGEILAWLTLPFTRPSEHEIQNLLLSALISFLLVSCIEWLRQPKIMIGSIRSPEQKWGEGKRELWNFRVSNARKWMFRPYSLSNLKVKIRIFDLDRNLKCEYQSIVVGPNSLEGTKPDPELLSGINLNLGEGEEFCFIYKHTCLNDVRGGVLHIGDYQYVAYPWHSDSKQRLASTSFVRDDSFCRLQPILYVVEVKIGSDQNEKIKKFILDLKYDSPSIRHFHLAERFRSRLFRWW
jgi:hypothetical protein